ncbi:MAG: gamma-glutamyltranspeptidase/glutathione hydrolase [Gammaproteobacteria bacterium]|jgi:gamma-glutamyltranspeptidase/glutathione hydrolase
MTFCTGLRLGTHPLAGLALAVVAQFGLAGCALFPKEHDPKGEWATPARGMVVSEHPLATQAGVDILEKGGNAADAAVATALALAVVYPQAGNLGGGGFALWVPHDVESDPVVFDFREVAPAGLTSEAFMDADGNLDRRLALASEISPGVPGSPAGLCDLHRRHGVLPFADVIRPARTLAREGFAVDAWLARDLVNPSIRARLEADPGSQQLFFPGGRPLSVGQLLVQPELERTLQRLERNGASGFYRGEVAQAIVDRLASRGGVMTLEDLQTYRAKRRPPMRAWFRGLEILTVPPPSSGGLVLLQVLALLDGFPLDEERQRVRDERERLAGHGLGPDEIGLSTRAVHWWIEALRRAFADRAVHMGDPDFFDVPSLALLDPSAIAARRITISERATPDIGPMDVTPAPESEETTHLSVLDSDGNAVSLTTTLNTSFGCGIWVPGGGFLLNNELDDFALQPGVPNAYGLVGSDANALEPGKRPLSSMTPTVVREGGRGVRLVLGAPGGPKIITAVLQVLLRTEVYGQELRAAVAAPRLHQQWKPSRTDFEEGWDPELLRELSEDRKHELRVVEGGRFASVQAIRVLSGGEPVGASDPRRGGTSQGEDRPASLPALPPKD